MENALIINPAEYRIETSKANELIGNLPQIKAERQVLEAQYNGQAIGKEKKWFKKWNLKVSFSNQWFQ